MTNSSDYVAVDTLLPDEPLPLRQIFYPLGFPVEVETNHPGVHAVAACNWPRQHEIETTPALKVRIGVIETGSQVRPPAPTSRAHRHLITFIADQKNFIIVDLQEGFAFGWMTSAAIHHQDYFHYCFLEAVTMTLLCSKHVMPMHAACVGLAGSSLLLSGQSGAGKSTLAYACARSGWSYTSDDSCYLLRDRDKIEVRGNARQFRFRPAARELFPELEGYGITPRVAGKPSIEVPSAELPQVTASPEARVDAMILLSRHSSPHVELVPLNTSDTMHMLEESLIPLSYISDQQKTTLARLLRVPAFVLRYRDLDPAIERLRKLVHKLGNESPNQRAGSKR